MTSKSLGLTTWSYPAFLTLFSQNNGSTVTKQPKMQSQDLNLGSLLQLAQHTKAKGCPVGAISTAGRLREKVTKAAAEEQCLQNGTATLPRGPGTKYVLWGLPRQEGPLALGQHRHPCAAARRHQCVLRTSRNTATTAHPMERTCKSQNESVSSPG